MDSEPNYESMPHDPEPSYASVDRPGDSDADPNYESVVHNDPNYESVKYMSVSRKEEPPYEQVASCKLSSGYEKINRTVESGQNPDYEKIKSDSEQNPDYEKIEPNGKEDTRCEKV